MSRVSLATAKLRATLGVAGGAGMQRTQGLGAPHQRRRRLPVFNFVATDYVVFSDFIRPLKSLNRSFVVNYHRSLINGSKSNSWFLSANKSAQLFVIDFIVAGP